MNKERLKRIKLIYYPYKIINKISGNVKWKYSEFISLKQLGSLSKKRKNSNTINIIFIVQYIPSWEKADYLYKYLEKKDKFVLKILCVPNNIEYPFDSDNEVYEYFLEKGYSVINACTENGWFDIGTIESDYIFTFRPYDHFMPNEYSARNLSKAGKLCNIIYGPPMTEELQRVVYDRFFFNYVCIFFAESEEAKQFFEKRHQKGVKKGLQRAIFCGMPILEYINKKDFEDEISAWHESGRPKLLWTPRWSTDKSIGGSHFFDYKDDLIEVAEKGYCNLIIRPHPLMFSNFVKTGEMTKEEYITFCKMCKEKNVLIDLSEVYLRTFIDTDILITDLSSIVQEFFVLGKPIVYCPPSADVHQTKTMKKIVSACYIVNDSIELNTVLMNLLRGDDILFDKRKKVFDELFGETIDCSCELITDFLIEDFGGKE